jgi:ATP-binding protein involved in chromosome partitioning
MTTSATLTVDSIKAKLAEVADPAFTALGLKNDLVSWRLFKGAEVDGQSALVRIELPTHAYPAAARRELTSLIERAVKELGATSVTVTFDVVTAFNPPPSDKAILKGPKNVIAVAAGKGGVGKSTVAVNLALSLARAGAKVGIVDTDVFGPSIPTMLGPAERAVAVSDNDMLVPALHQGLEVLSVGFFVSPKEAVTWRGPRVDALLKQFLGGAKWGELDYLVCDLPPGTGDVQISLSQILSLAGAVMVTTPQEISIIDVVKGIAMFEKVEVPILGVVENMSFYTCPACGHHDEIFAHGGGARLAKELGTTFFGEIPIDTRIRFGGDAGVPIVVAAPDSENARRFLHIAEQTALKIAAAILSKPKRGPRLSVIK